MATSPTMSLTRHPAARLVTRISALFAGGTVLFTCVFAAVTLLVGALFSVPLVLLAPLWVSGSFWALLLGG